MKIAVYALVVLAYSQYVFGKYTFTKDHILNTSFAVAVTIQKKKCQAFQIVPISSLVSSHLLMQRKKDKTGL